MIFLLNRHTFISTRQIHKSSDEILGILVACIFHLVNFLNRIRDDTPKGLKKIARGEGDEGNERGEGCGEESR